MLADTDITFALAIRWPKERLFVNWTGMASAGFAFFQLKSKYLDSIFSSNAAIFSQINDDMPQTLGSMRSLRINLASE